MLYHAKLLLPGAWTSAQIDLQSLPALARDGVRRIISHRPDDEEPGQPSAEAMSAAAVAVGMEFVHIPVSGLPDAEAVKATADALADGVPVLMFCRSGTRSTIAWALAMRALDRADAETLRAAAAGAGYDISRLPL